MEKFKEGHMEDYVDLFRDFEIKKREIKTSRDEKVTFRIPVTLIDLVKEVTGKGFKDLIQQSSHKNKIRVVSDKIRVDNSVATSLFDGPVQSILSHVADLLQHPSVQDCQAIVMVGGFSDSPVLQTRVRDQFGSMKIIVPQDAGLAVLKGAVIFGHKPMSITERVCKYTYGEGTTHKFSESCTHKVGKREKDGNGDMRCFDIFAIHVRVGQTVKIGDEQQERTFTPVTDDQTSIATHIYASEEQNPDLVTEPGSQHIGSLTIPIPDTSLGRNREFGTTFLFGGTEVQVKVTDKASKKVYTTRVDFLG